MKANIYLKDEKVICNVLDCNGIAKFKWFYQINESYKLTKIGQVGNIISSFGYGIYVCEVECNNFKIQVSNTFSPNEIIGRRENVFNVFEKSQNPAKVISGYLQWDFTKFPEERFEEILDLVKKEDWKALVKIHDKYNVSENTYCCNMDNVKENYLKYVEMPREGSEVVRSGEPQNA